MQPFAQRSLTVDIREGAWYWRALAGKIHGITVPLWRNRLVPPRFQQEGEDIWSGRQNCVVRTPGDVGGVTSLGYAVAEAGIGGAGLPLRRSATTSAI
jgi:hypothetical protein